MDPLENQPPQPPTADTQPPVPPQAPSQPVTLTPPQPPTLEGAAPIQTPPPAPAMGYSPVAAPAGQSMPYQTVPSLQGNNKKKTLIIIGIAVALVALGVTIAFVLLFSVSKKDYSAAVSQYNEVTSANYTLESKLSSIQYGVSSDTDTSFNNDIDAAKKAVDKVREEDAELAKLKAVRVGEGSTKYKAFHTKLDAYLTYSNNIVTSLADARDAVETCGEADETSSSYSSVKSYINSCIAALEKASDVPDADVKEFLNKMKDEYTNLSGIVTKLAAITDPYGDQYDQYKSLRDQTYAVMENVSDARTDFQSNIEKHAKAADPKDAADELSKYLENKATS